MACRPIRTVAAKQLSLFDVQLCATAPPGAPNPNPAYSARYQFGLGFHPASAIRGSCREKVLPIVSADAPVALPNGNCSPVRIEAWNPAFAGGASEGLGGGGAAAGGGGGG